MITALLEDTPTLSWSKSFRHTLHLGRTAFPPCLSRLSRVATLCEEEAVIGFDDRLEWAGLTTLLPPLHALSILSHSCVYHIFAHTPFVFVTHLHLPTSTRRGGSQPHLCWRALPHQPSHYALALRASDHLFFFLIMLGVDEEDIMDIQCPEDTEQGYGTLCMHVLADWKGQPELGCLATLAEDRTQVG
ncbi:hypothetical protein LX36DRAFT_278451 [Colletotrichum falcatum]|nr:hypothetical protein LX36DRAFT_278451 [Colletotrichum falcatum]